MQVGSDAGAQAAVRVAVPQQPPAHGSSGVPGCHARPTAWPSTVRQAPLGGVSVPTSCVECSHLLGVLRRSIGGQRIAALLVSEFLEWRLAGVARHLPRLGFPRPPCTVSAIGVAALGAVGALADQSVDAVGPADDRPGPGGGSASVAFAVQLDHHVGGQSGVLLLAADPPIQLRRRPLWSRRHPRVERHEYRVQGRGGRPPATLAGREGAFGFDPVVRNRLGCQPRWHCRDRGRPGGPPGSPGQFPEEPGLGSQPCP